MSFEELAKQDPRFDSSISSKISDEDDELDLQTNGKGLVVKENLKERAAYIPPKIYCSRCKENIHNIAENDQRCLGSRKKGRTDCQCSCQTHYVGRDGKLRKYGTPDDSFTKDEEPKIDHSLDAEYARITAEYHKLHGTNPQTIQEKDDAWYKQNDIPKPERTI